MKFRAIALSALLVGCGGGGGGGSSQSNIGSDEQSNTPVDTTPPVANTSYYYESPLTTEHDISEDKIYQNANSITHALTFLLYEYNTFVFNSSVPIQINNEWLPSDTATKDCEIDGSYTASVYAPSVTEQGYNRVLYANEYMNIEFHECAAVMFRSVLYADGAHNTKVTEGAYNSNDAIINPTKFEEEFINLATYDSQLVHTYQHGTIKHVVTDITHQVTMDDFETHDVFWHHGYSTRIFKDATLTVTEIPGSNYYSASFQLTNDSPFTLSTRPELNEYTVNIIEPVIIDRFTGDAIFDGVVEVAAGITKMKLDYKLGYTDVSLDIDGDGSYDAFETIDDIFYD